MSKDPEIFTRSGACINLLSPNPAMFDPADIGFALDHLNRFTGHADPYISIGRHCVSMAQYALSLWLMKDRPKRIPHPGLCLLHDAAEAYLGDVSRPLKSLLPRYEAMEHMFEERLFRKFLPEGVDTHNNRVLVKELDNWFLLAEATAAGLRTRENRHRWPEDIPCDQRTWHFPALIEFEGEVISTFLHPLIPTWEDMFHHLQRQGLIL